MQIDNEKIKQMRRSMYTYFNLVVKSKNGLIVDATNFKANSFEGNPSDDDKVVLGYIKWMVRAGYDHTQILNNHIPNITQAEIDIYYKSFNVVVDKFIKSSVDIDETQYILNDMQIDVKEDTNVEVVQQQESSKKIEHVVEKTFYNHFDLEEFRFEESSIKEIIFKLIEYVKSKKIIINNELESVDLWKQHFSEFMSFYAFSILVKEIEGYFNE